MSTRARGRKKSGFERRRSNSTPVRKIDRGDGWSRMNLEPLIGRFLEDLLQMTKSASFCMSAERNIKIKWFAAYDVPQFFNFANASK
jgi:hypothetical protein